MEIKLTEVKQSFLEANLIELQFIAIFGGMILLFLIEGFIPRRHSESDQTNRWISNIVLAIFNHFLILVYTAALFKLLALIQPESSLLRHFGLSDIPVFIIVLLLMDFLTYWIHRSFHKVPILWRIHAVHHSDTEIDVTTSHRHHPLEPMISSLLLTPIVFALGAPLVVMAAYSFVLTASSLISHSNLSLPHKIDNFLRFFVITPDFHRIHHSSDKPFTNSNYGGILPWFDYLFRTYKRKPYSDIPEMEVGLEVMRETSDNRLDKVFLTPFIYKP